MGCGSSSDIRTNNKSDNNNNKSQSNNNNNNNSAKSNNKNDISSSKGHHPRSSKLSASSPKGLDLANLSGYTLWVHICQAKEIKKMDWLSESDAYVKVKVDDSAWQQTTVVNGSAKPVWNETFQFTGFDDIPQKLTLTCLDKDTITSDDKIGLVELDLSEYWKNGGSDFIWLPLRKKGFFGPEKTNGQVQIKIDIHSPKEEKINPIAHYKFTHLLEIVVQNGMDLKGMDVVGRNDSYVQVVWATKKFRTKTISGSKPVWNESVYFWANEESQRNHQITFTAFDQDVSKDDEIGTGYISLQDNFENPGEFIEHKVALGSAAQKDVDLTSGEQKADWSRGRLIVKVRALEKQALMENFFIRMLSTFDMGGEGSLTREEVSAMLETLGTPLTQDEFETLWTASDRDDSGTITRDEAQLFFKALMFVNPKTANAVASFLSNGDNIENNLMVGVTTEGKQKELEVYHRLTGVVVKENIPAYIQVALKSMYSSKTGRFLTQTHRTQKIINNMSIKQGKKYDSEDSRSEIPKFIRLHKLNVEEFEKSPADYATFNEFFARRIKLDQFRPMAEPNNSAIAVSPADCRLSVFPDVNDATSLWIKGDEFTVENVLGPVADRLAPLFKSGSLCIARLAPQDYHRWHFPCGGKLGPRTLIPGALYTVNPIAINENVNVFTANKREICEIDSPDFGKVVMVAVGAAMVGSITITAADNAVVQKGDEHGYFSFGGSTVLVFFEKDRIEFDGDLVANSNKKIETLITVRASLGKALQPAN